MTVERAVRSRLGRVYCRHDWTPEKWAILLAAATAGVVAGEDDDAMVARLLPFWAGMTGFDVAREVRQAVGVLRTVRRPPSAPT